MSEYEKLSIMRKYLIRLLDSPEEIITLATKVLATLGNFRAKKVADFAYDGQEDEIGNRLINSSYPLVRYPFRDKVAIYNRGRGDCGFAAVSQYFVGKANFINHKFE